MVNTIRYRSANVVRGIPFKEDDDCRSQSASFLWLTLLHHSTREAISEVIQHKARILLAEDNITNQQATLAVLENMGLGVDAVANGQQAITALESAPYDLVLMDCQMPVLDGYEATRLIRNGPSRVRNRHVPVIAMTAYAVQSERDMCHACGMDDFLPKPVLPQALAEILNKWLPLDSSWSMPLTASTAPAQPQVCANVLPIWDRRGMLARLMGDERVAQTLIEGFLTDLPQQMQVLETSLSQGNILAIMRQAHSIKGAAAIIGGERLQAAALAMEQSAPKGHVPTLQAQIEALRLEFAILQQKMQQNSIQNENE